MIGGSPLANAVVSITANTIGLDRGLANSMALLIHGLGQMSMSAMASSSRIVQAFGLIQGAAVATTVGIFSLTAALGGLARAGGTVEAAGHNIEQVFGRSSVAVEAAADHQAKAFGRSKSEYLAYAAEIGRQLEKLGVSEDVAAKQTMGLLDAVSRLAESRRISFGEAFQEVQTRGALFADADVRGEALRLGFRNRVIDEGTEALIRNKLAIDQINMSTDNATESGSNWTSQVNALQGNLTNLGQTIGAEIEPVFTDFLRSVNDALQVVMANWEKWNWLIKAGMGPLALLFDTELPRAEQDLDAISKRNEARIGDDRNRRLAGQAMGAGGGAGGGGFIGGLSEFWQHVQMSGFNRRQMAIMEAQLKAMERVAGGMDRIAARPAGHQIMGNPADRGQVPWR